MESPLTALAIPSVGVFAEGRDLSLYSYDSCECLRPLDENPRAVSRPCGWSCEEIGGIAVGENHWEVELYEFVGHGG